MASGAVHRTGIFPPRVVYASLAFSISRESPKSAILHTREAFTKTFRAARSEIFYDIKNYVLLKSKNVVFTSMNIIHITQIRHSGCNPP